MSHKSVCVFIDHFKSLSSYLILIILSTFPHCEKERESNVFIHSGMLERSFTFKISPTIQNENSKDISKLNTY